MARTPGQPRRPGSGFKKKIARLEARVAELEQALGESDAELRRLKDICRFYLIDPAHNPFSSSCSPRRTP